ncbi:ABC transporter ATP-binding protein [Dermabacter sp. p3-SID358]|uniref:ABC transporter ATP-binding protein n=1 Tax=Dermabacter sp. p3-SID358 TaxID=2916114 RepID=UPI0021A3A09F|nr:ABC transporter ATP-binding protein [Dermabacter sp. p3-SID358]MCT1867110.1 ABC transporter ATP-binding protein [Dermabacter sp. p3-SID358]
MALPSHSPEANRAAHAIVFDDVSVHYRTQKLPSVENVSFTIGWGEKVAIVGPSGSGKSTLVHVMNGLVPHRFEASVSGSVRVGGVDPVRAPLVRTAGEAGTVLQDSNAQFVALTVAEDIAFSLENQEVASGDMPGIVERVAKRVGLTELLEHSPHELSGGQKQRVAVAGVLVDDVPILLFDEPLANLDPATGRAMIELADDLNRESGASVVIIEHRLEEVLHRGVDRILMMAGGRLVADTTPDELVTSGLLTEHGIRRPLHLTALNYAGIEPPASAHPARLEALRLSESECARVREWGREQWAARSGAASVKRESGEGSDATLAISVRNLHVLHGHDQDHEGVHALRGIDLEIRRGEMLAILGNNGAGKSTLASAITGFMKPNSGTVEVLGDDVLNLSIAEIGTRVGFVLQEPGHMISKPLIFDEVALGPRAHGLDEEEVRRRVESALETCGLTPFKSWPVSALSHGQKKRVTIAAALALEPEILILDEPTAGQDFRHYTEFMEFIRELNRGGTTILLITHDMHLALEYVPRAVVLSEGEIIADSSPARILVDDDVTRRANLVRTSLDALAATVGLPVSTDNGGTQEFGRSEFIEAVIAVDREKREVGDAR